MKASDFYLQFYDWLKPLSKKDSLSFELYGYTSFSNSISLSKKNKKGSSSQSQHINLRVSQGEKAGLSYTKDFSKDSLTACYQKAKDSLHFTENESIGLLSENQNYSKENSFYNSDTGNLSQQEKLKELEKFHKTCSSFDKKVQPIQLSLKNEEKLSFFINSLGSVSNFKISNLLTSGYCMGVDGDSRSQNYFTKHFKKLSEFQPEKMGKELAGLILKKLNSKTPETKKYPVIFKPEQAGSSLISALSDLMNARRIFDKLSVLKLPSLNQKKFASELSLYDDPLKSSGFCSQIFDGEGFASQKTTLVEKGVVKNFLSSSFYAKKLKIPHTKKASWGVDGSGMDISTGNLIMETGNSSFEEMLCEFPQVIVIDTLKSFAGYNPVSGDFSIESEGFLYEGKDVLYPLTQFTVSGNIIELFSSLSKIENQGYSSPFAECSSFLVSELSISGK